MSPLRIAALQPSISITLERLGALNQLVACTRYCVDAVPALKDMPVKVIQDSWSASAEEIMSVQPDLVVASVPYRMEALAAILKAGRPVMCFSPKCLGDIYADTQLLGRIVDRVETAEILITAMLDEARAISTKAQQAKTRPLVYCEEWGKPLIHSQRWVEELVETAGGRCLGTPGAQTDADTVLAADPDVLIFAWCGAGDRVPLEKIVRQRGWDCSSGDGMRAVRTGRVYCVRDEWLNTPAVNLLHGLHSLAAALHPGLFREFAAPRSLRRAVDPTNSPPAASV